MPRPTQLPLWATDANYPAGSDPWAGSPTKVAPTSGDQARGWTPNQEPSPQAFNWWKNLVGQWFTWLDDQTFNTFLGPAQWQPSSGSTVGDFLTGFSEAKAQVNLRPGTPLASAAFRYRTPLVGSGMGFYVLHHLPSGASSIVTFNDSGISSGGVDATFTLTFPANYLYPTTGCLTLLVTGDNVDDNRFYNAQVNLA